MNFFKLVKDGELRILEENLTYLDTEIKNEEGFTLLHEAVKNGNYDIVDFLLLEGMDPNERSKDGSTSLHFAVESGDMDIVKLLMEYGADLYVKNNRQRTAVQVASLMNNHRMLGVLEEMSWDYGTFYDIKEPKKFQLRDWDE